MKSKCRLLIVDDEKSILDILRELFQREGFSVSTAHDGETAISLFRDDPFDVVLTDIAMPGMDGYDVMRLILHEKSTTPVILMTAHGDIRGAVSAMKDGASDYITKPFNMAEPLIRVESALRKVEMERTFEELKRRGEMLRHAKAIARIGANVAHIFGNKLTIIKNSQKIFEKTIDLLPQLLDNCGDAEVRRKTEFLHKDGSRIMADSLHYIDDLNHTLDRWHKLSTFRPGEPAVPVNPVECMETALLLTQHETHKGCDIDIDFKKPIPFIMGNFNNVTRFFINLIFNAVDATVALKKTGISRKGEIFISMLPETTSLRVNISDNGIGIDSELAGRINCHFTTSERVFPPDCFGLEDCRAIIRQYRKHWGTANLSFDSDGPCQGSVFMITFPAIE